MQTPVKNGFSLIELLVAMFVLALAALSLAQMMTTGLWVNARTKDDTQLATIAQTYMENLASVGYGGLVPGGDLHPTTPDPLYSRLNWRVEDSTLVSDGSLFHPNAVTYDVFWSVTDAVTNTNHPCREIAVRVVSNRMIKGGAPQEVTMRTQLVQPHL